MVNQEHMEEIYNILRRSYPLLEEIKYKPSNSTVLITFSPPSDLEWQKTIVVNVEGMTTKRIEDKIKRVLIDECGGSEVIM